MPRKAKIKGIDRSQLLILSLIAGFVPLVYSTGTLDPVMAPRMLLLPLLTLALLVLLVPAIRREHDRSGMDIFGRRVFLFAILLVGLTALSCFKSSLPGESIFELLKGLVPFLFLVPCTLLFFRRRETVTLVSRLISVVALGISLIGLSQFFGLAFLWLPGNIIPYATMANKNLLSSFLFLSLPWSFMVTGKAPKFWRLVGILSLYLSLLLIVLSRTRAVWVAIALAALIALLLLLLMDRQARRSGLRERFITGRTLVGSTTWLVLLIGLIYVADASSMRSSLPNGAESVGESPEPSSPSESLIERAESVVRARDPSVRDRLAIWSRSLEMIGQNPLMGVGPGQWRVHIAGYGTGGLRTETGIIHFQRPHNDYLWIASESGIPSLLLYIAFLVTGLVYCWRLMLATSNRQEKIQALLLFSGLIGFMVISFFSYPKERPVHMTYLMLIMGNIISMYHRQNPISKKPGRVSFLLAWPIMATLLLAAAALAWSRIESEKHINLAYLYQERNNWAGMIAEIDQAETFITPMDPTATPLAWYRGIANSALSRSDAALERSDAALERSNAAFEDFKEAYRVNRNHLFVLTNLGTAYEMKGDHNHAIVYYQKALEISPGFKDAALNLTAVYYNAGEYGKAFETISGIKRPHEDPRYQLYLDKIRKHFSEDSAGSAKEKQ